MLDFPNAPTVGQLFSSGKGTFAWDGVKWVPVSAGGFGDAPNDGSLYGRQSQAWAQIPAQAGSLVSESVYSTSQTITIPVGVTKAKVFMWGATGGSGGATGVITGSTGAGGYLEKYLIGLTAGNTLIYTQGAAGTAGASGSGVGGNGGITTLASGTQTIGTLTCNGSNGSAGSTTASTAGTPGGTASGGDINLVGQDGTGLLAAGAPGGVGGGTFPQEGMTMYSRGAPGRNSSAAAAGNPGNPGGLKIAWYS